MAIGWLCSLPSAPTLFKLLLSAAAVGWRSNGEFWSPLDLNRAAQLNWAIRNLNCSRKIAADGSPSNGGVSLCGSDHLCGRWISHPTVLATSQPDRPFRIQRGWCWAHDLWFGSAPSFASDPSRLLSRCPVAPRFFWSSSSPCACVRHGRGEVRSGHLPTTMC